MSGHSPSPWILLDDTTFSTLGDKRVVAADRISPAIVFGGIAECDANARLIAAAPDLLAALKTFFVKWEAVLPAINSAFFMQQNHGMPYSGPTLEDELKQMQAAIAKAEGVA